MSRRVRFGRVSVYFEPRDLWVGAYVAPDAVYVCLVPVLVVKIDRNVLCKRCLSLTGKSWRITHEWRESRLCPSCLWGPIERSA